MACRAGHTGRCRLRRRYVPWLKVCRVKLGENDEGEWFEGTHVWVVLKGNRRGMHFVSFLWGRGSPIFEAYSCPSPTWLLTGHLLRKLVQVPSQLGCSLA